MKPSALAVFLAVLILLISLIPAVLFIRELSGDSVWLYSGRFIGTGLRLGIFTVLVLGIIGAALVGGIVIISRDCQRSEAKWAAGQEKELALASANAKGVDEMLDSLRASLDHLKVLNGQLRDRAMILVQINRNLAMNQPRRLTAGEEQGSYQNDFPPCAEDSPEPETHEKGAEAKRILDFHQITLNSSSTITYFR
jgi:hypothetical protein